METTRNPFLNSEAVVASRRCEGFSHLRYQLPAFAPPVPGLGEHEAARDFAKAAPRKATERLAAYAASQRAKEPETEVREFLATIDAALRSGDAEKAVERAGSLPRPLDSVCRIRLAHASGMALRQARRLEESAKVLREAAEAAVALGWLGRACEFLHKSGLSAWNRGDWRWALSAWTACLELTETLGRRRSQPRRSATSA